MAFICVVVRVHLGSRNVISENLNYFRQKLYPSTRTSSLTRPHFDIYSSYTLTSSYSYNTGHLTIIKLNITYCCFLVLLIFNQSRANTNDVQTCQVNLWQPLFAADGIVSLVSLQCIIAMYNSNNNRHNRNSSYRQKFAK